MSEAKKMTEIEKEDMRKYTNVLVSQIDDYPSLVIINNVAAALKARHDLDKEEVMG